MVVFTCIDCDIEVTDIIAESIPAPALCLSCRVIRDAPEEDRDALRKVFRVPASGHHV